MATFTDLLTSVKSAFTDTTEEEPITLEETVEKQATTPTLAEGTEQTYTPLQTGVGEELTGDGATISTVTEAGQVVVAAPPEAVQTEAEAALQTPVAPMTASTMTASTVDTAAQATAAQGEVSAGALIVDPVQGVVREESLAVAAEGEMPREAFIINQLSDLLGATENGEIPAWAKPAVDFANADLLARGVGKSHVARDSLFNAIIQAAMPIATGDARTKQVEFLKNLDNRQQAVMFNASVMANMDAMNASFNQKAQMANAQAFLQMDFVNLQNEQRTNEINMQARQQVLLSDQAAENASRQFNASSENQTKQFMANLSAMVEKYNADRLTSVSEFNAQSATQLSMYNTGNIFEAEKLQANIDAQMSQFNSQLLFNRDQFNATNALVIEQSNVDWRRRMNEIDTAGVNAVNQANTMNLFNLSNQALTMLWQAERDDAQWIWQSSESALDRANRIAISAIGNEAAADKLNLDTWTSIGQLGIDLFNIYDEGEE